MKIPRDLSGRAVVKALCKHWDYRQVHQEGSHIILQTDKPSPQRIPVPDHGALRIGTLNSILRLVATTRASTNRTCLPRSDASPLTALECSSVFRFRLRRRSRRRLGQA